MYAKSKRLKNEEVQELIRKWRETGDAKARDTVITAHVPLVEYLVKKKYGWYGDQDGELVHEGVIGLARAVDLYEFGHRVSFATYSSQWILARVSRCVSFGQGHSPRYRLAYLRREELRERLDNGECPSSVGKSVRMKADTLLRALQACEPMVRLDWTVDGINSPLHDIVAANDDGVDEPYFDDEHRAKLRKYANKLPMRLRGVVKHRLRGKSQQFIAKLFGCTHGYISILEKRAVLAMRAMIEEEERKAS